MSARRYPSASTFSFFSRSALDWLPAQWVGADRSGEGRSFGGARHVAVAAQNRATASALPHPSSAPNHRLARPTLELGVGDAGGIPDWRVPHFPVGGPVCRSPRPLGQAVTTTIRPPEALDLWDQCIRETASADGLGRRLPGESQRREIPRCPGNSSADVPYCGRSSRRALPTESRPRPWVCTAEWLVAPLADPYGPRVLAAGLRPCFKTLVKNLEA
jgi:hypothetical protein